MPTQTHFGSNAKNDTKQHVGCKDEPIRPSEQFRLTMRRMHATSASPPKYTASLGAIKSVWLN